MKAARIAAKRLCGDGDEATEVLYAALFPSDDIHWVRREVLDELAALVAA